MFKDWKFWLTIVIVCGVVFFATKHKYGKKDADTQTKTTDTNGSAE